MRLSPSILVAVLLPVATSESPGQEQRFAFPPPAPGVTVTRNIRYATSDSGALMMDVYRPPRSAGRRLPTLIFFNRAFGPQRADAFYAAWARTAASQGVVAVIPDLRDGNQAHDFANLLTHLARAGGSLGIDTASIAVYAASGNVSTALPLLEDPGQTLVKAAVIYYGAAPITQFRLDLPVLMVRAGLDRPALNQAMTTLAALAVNQNAPVTLLNHPGGYHGFEIFNDDDATRDVIQRSIDFVRRVTAPSYQAAMRRQIPEATAAGSVLTGNYRQAASVYAEMLRSRPEDARMRLAYGEALLGDAQFAVACAEFEKLKGKGLGPRDLGLPASRACVQAGDADAAVAWLKSIPSRFLPAAVQNEAVYTPLRGRADFQALFAGR